MSRTRRRAGLAVLALLMLATGCVSMPDSGPVHNADTSADSSGAEASSIDAVPPAPGAPAADIVNGFINAMSAWPIDIGAARQYLSQEAAGAWNPDQGTITFDAALPPQVSGNVATVDLQGAEQLDASGAWQGDLPDDEQQLTFHLTSEDGEFRITDPRDALIVRDSWFAQRFIQVSLYFFDRTGRILVPEPVFVPRGGQLASTLTNRLLEPGEDLQRNLPHLPPDGRRRAVRAGVRSGDRPDRSRRQQLRTTEGRRSGPDAGPARLDPAPGPRDPGAPGLDRRRGTTTARRRQPVRRQRGVAVRPVRLRRQHPALRPARRSDGLRRARLDRPRRRPVR